MTIGRRWLQRAGTRSAALAGFVAAAFALVPAGRLACEKPYLTERSPDRQWTIDVCGRARILAMPGSGSDAPGWIVLRDSHHAIRGISNLAMLQLYGTTLGETQWRARMVSRALVFELPLVPAHGAFSRWWDERVWRWRALLGITPSDEDVR